LLKALAFWAGSITWIANSQIPSQLWLLSFHHALDGLVPLDVRANYHVSRNSWLIDLYQTFHLAWGLCQPTFGNKSIMGMKALVWLTDENHPENEFRKKKKKKSVQRKENARRGWIVFFTVA
jgi:hypothetical protein